MIYALHGTLGGGDDWDALGLDDLCAIDLWENVSALEEFGESLAIQVEASGDPAPILLGYSMGGRLALHAMAAKPALWAGAIIISAHPGLASEEERAARREADAVWAEKARSLPWSEFLDQWNAQPVLAGQKPSETQLALESRREQVAQSFEKWSLGRQEHVASHLMGCHFPVLWITGEQDQKFTDLGAEMGQVIADFEHQAIPDCGHRLIFEVPDQLQVSVREFVAKRIDHSY